MTEARPTTDGTGPAAPGRRPDPPRPSTHPPSGPHPLPRQPDAAADHDGADGRGQAYAAPARAPLADARGPREPTTRLTSHGCWYPSADPGGDRVAFICDRGGVPQLWAGPVAGDDVRLLDAGPDPVREVSWSPDGRWIAYTTAPGGGEHTRVLCVRPDGTDRHILAGAEPGTSAYLGCWAHDGSALAVTVAVPTAPYAAPVTVAAANGDTEGLPAGWSSRDGTAVLLGAGARYDTGTTTPAPAPPFTTLAALADQGEDQHGAGTSPGFADGLSAYLLDPDGIAAPVLLATEADAATLRVCDLSRDGSFALLRRGPRGRREAVVVRTADATPTYVVPVADGDPWIGRFSPRADTLWLRSNAHREFAALIAATLDAEGHVHGWSVAAERDGSDLELLGFGRDGRTAVLAWNVGGATELEVVDTPARAAGAGPSPAGAPRPVPLPHEVVTRIVPAGGAGLVLALSGSQRRPGVWWLAGGTSLLRTPWSSRDEDAVPPGRRPTRPVPLRPTARDGLPLHGWYYRAPGRDPGEPAPCVIHLHGGPEEQERPVFNPLYHEILGRGLDVFAPDVRGSSGHGRSFVDADLGEGRFAALDDVADCAAHAVLAGPADPARLAVMGRSYGGYLTFASLVWHPDLFRTGVAVCGMSDLLTFFEGTEPWIAQSAAHKYGHPERDRDLLRALSPMSRIDALRAPVLAVHGEHDTNVPPQESEQFVRAARARGRTAELLTLLDEGHDFQRAPNRRLFRRATADWLQRHLTS
ncbi:prolyl oligopeptidase family serine peptidase [Streptomyces lasalocidi]|uniref:S9 family peptidase n=1 Tax=Streptomyces lasalocidi TaxID=324833 RepID=A0A4V6AV96_STRLS|nr:prolyl oligopeptidase family serine peptidase [Streptomyces lasalocidi]TKS99032.1 S9 family peptidase [Streptomyces lasalocidi]